MKMSIHIRRYLKNSLRVTTTVRFCGGHLQSSPCSQPSAPLWRMLPPALSVSALHTLSPTHCRLTLHGILKSPLHPVCSISDLVFSLSAQQSSAPNTLGVHSVKSRVKQNLLQLECKALQTPTTVRSYRFLPLFLYKFSLASTSAVFLCYHEISSTFSAPPLCSHHSIEFSMTVFPKCCLMDWTALCL